MVSKVHISKRSFSHKFRLDKKSVRFFKAGIIGLCGIFGFLKHDKFDFELLTLVCQVSVVFSVLTMLQELFISVKAGIFGLWGIFGIVVIEPIKSNIYISALVSQVLVVSLALVMLQE